MVNFPPSFRTTSQLKTFLNRFMWLNLFHATLNYHTELLYMPLSLEKIYENNDGTEMPFPKAASGNVLNVVSIEFLICTRIINQDEKKTCSNLSEGLIS